MIRTQALVLATAFGVVVLCRPASADPIMELAEQCRSAVEAGDDAAFQAAAAQLVELRHVWNTEAILIGSECLTKGFGTAWDYSYPQSRFVSKDQVEAEAKAAADASAASARATDEAERQAAARAAAELAADIEREARRKANASRVSDLVYASCATLLERDQVAAMTNSICVESFLTNGLPSP
jgi:hypothetical protein